VGTGETAFYTVSAVIFMMLCYFARMRYPWFFINPVGVTLVSV